MLQLLMEVLWHLAPPYGGGGQCSLDIVEFIGNRVVTVRGGVAAGECEDCSVLVAGHLATLPQFLGILRVCLQFVDKQLSALVSTNGCLRV